MMFRTNGLLLYNSLQHHWYMCVVRECICTNVFVMYVQCLNYILYICLQVQVWCPGVCVMCEYVCTNVLPMSV